MKKFTDTFEPRFSETDALGHINNSIVPIWCEAYRVPIFKLFNPNQDLNKWNLIVANINVDYLKPIMYGSSVDVTTYVSKVGKSSFVVTQELEQNGEAVAIQSTVMVHFNYQTNKAEPIPGAIKAQL